MFICGFPYIKRQGVWDFGYGFALLLTVGWWIVVLTPRRYTMIAIEQIQLWLSYNMWFNESQYILSW